MTLQEFTASLTHSQPPAGLSPLLQALWHDANGNWTAAHNLAQSQEGTPDFDRLHAYLHRKEGDEGNARYWYRRAGIAPFRGTLQEEWTALITAWLERT